MRKPHTSQCQPLQYQRMSPSQNIGKRNVARIFSVLSFVHEPNLIFHFSSVLDFLFFLSLSLTPIDTRHSNTSSTIKYSIASRSTWLGMSNAVQFDAKFSHSSNQNRMWEVKEKQQRQRRISMVCTFSIRICGE